MYVAVKGGETAIASAHALLAEKRRGSLAVPEITLEQISQQLGLSVDRVMSEASLYDPELAALAVKQAWGDMVEAIFLLRAYRTTLPRFCSTQPLDTAAMRVRRRISATYKDLPGGQILGPTFDYTHRLLDPELAHIFKRPNGGLKDQGGQGSQMGSGANDSFPNEPVAERMPHVLDILVAEGLMDKERHDPDAPVGDLTREPLTLPAGRDLRLQNLARADEGFLLALAYSTQRGFGNTHPFAGEIRTGEVEVEIIPEELGFAVCIGEITLTECESVNQFVGQFVGQCADQTDDHSTDESAVPSEGSGLPRFTRGYGLSFGHNERKAMSMALVDRALCGDDLGEPATDSPARDQEFVLMHSDNVEASGFTQHLKLPHYVDFQAELSLVRSIRNAGKNMNAGHGSGAGEVTNDGVMGEKSTGSGTDQATPAPSAQTTGK